MICPKCQKEMEKGKISPDRDPRYHIRYTSYIRWYSHSRKKGPHGFKVPEIVHTIGFDENGVTNNNESYFCPNCMFIITPVIDQSKVKVTEDYRLQDDIISQSRQSIKEMETKEKVNEENHYFKDGDL